MQYFLETAIPITAQNWSNNTSPLVSIQCITYNHEKYIRDALEGFLMQKTTFPVEILIHDDASTDNTANIIREYQAKYPQLFKPIYQIENQYSQKKGVITKIQNERTKGKYIAKCEGDDYWTDPLKLQKQVDFLEGNEDVYVCFHNRSVLDFNGVTIEAPFKRKNNYTKDTFILKHKMINTFMPTQTLMFRNKDLDTYSKINREGVYGGDVMLRAFCATKGDAYYLHFNGAVYRRNSGGVYSGDTKLNNLSKSESTRLSILNNLPNVHKYDLFLSLLKIKVITVQIKLKNKQLDLFKDLKDLLTYTYKTIVHFFKEHY